MHLTPAKTLWVRNRGSSVIEFALMMRWLIFLFVGAMDWGFYSYSLIATEAAARVGAMYAATSSATVADTTTVCAYALDQLRNMPNVGASLTTCLTSSSVTTSAPVGATAASVTGPDRSTAAQVSVTYLTPVFIPLPGSLTKQVTTLPSGYNVNRLNWLE